MPWKINACEGQLWGEWPTEESARTFAEKMLWVLDGVYELVYRE